MAVFAHFIDQLGHQQSRLLALRRQSGAHSGENLAGSLVDIVHEWEIEGRVGCAISDNMAANDNPKTVAKQLEEAAAAALPPNPTIEDLPKITWKNRRFVQEDSLARKGAKGRKSWIRSHGTFLVELNYQDQPIGHVWCCNRCDMKGAAEFFSVQATSSAADHLRKHVPVPFNIVHKIPSS
ncbi:hypothetical protein FOVG_18306 [Fusarium oxysporum f. sp. pisi HDV247]|uniref:BED-type domain-containing protein n=1 Tax=Fusarium oxysporum f. sp. pisi HDV247 TaxID=1080344 RepID=W9NC92_FUSOX|nr:hypothetical protein FOVG_18306 [Fusarium oxysporum f. sp. pisi HDV247]